MQGCRLVERDLQRSALASTQRRARPGWQHLTAPPGAERLRATVRNASETNRVLIPEPPGETATQLRAPSIESFWKPARDSAPEGGARSRRPFSADGASMLHRCPPSLVLVAIPPPKAPNPSRRRVFGHHPPRKLPAHRGRRHRRPSEPSPRGPRVGRPSAYRAHRPAGRRSELYSRRHGSRGEAR